MILGYIDPGMGSMVIQAVVAAIVGLPILFRHQITRVLRLLRRGDGSESPVGD